MQYEFGTGSDPDPLAELIEYESHQTASPAGAAHHNSPSIPMPGSWGWAASADLLSYLVDIIRQRRPSHIVELGSGTSTCWLAWALDRFGISGTVVSLEHLSEFRRRTLTQLRRCGVQHRAEVRLAPLTDVLIDGTPYRWYDPVGWSDLRACDLLLVDGPPGRTAPMARYPAVPLLGSAMRPEATVVLDDYKRRDEQRTVARWRQLHPDWRLQELEHRKGTAVLTVAGP